MDDVHDSWEAPMLGSSDLIAFIAAADLDVARDFYAESLGLKLIDESGFACVFEAHGTMVRVTLVAGHLPADHTVLGWRSHDISEEVRALTSHGVEFVRYPAVEQDDLGIWTAPGGDRIAWFTDPDGNVLSLTQFV
jgi:catechol 2,3-dioxygenase-like lactoylglutathione lyase family enzyme